MTHLRELLRDAAPEPPPFDITSLLSERQRRAQHRSVRPFLLGFAAIALVAVIATVLVSRNGSSDDAARQRDDADFLVFMSIRATDAEIADVARTLRASPRVTRFQYASQEDAFRNFQRYSNLSIPGLDGGPLTPADFPASFDVHARTQRDTKRLAPRLRRLPGVDGIQFSPTARDERRVCEGIEKAIEKAIEKDTEKATEKPTKKATKRATENLPQHLKKTCAPYW